MKNFKTLKVWQLGQVIAAQVYRLTLSMSGHEKFVFASQLARSAISIPSNIAEGNSRQSRRDYARFIEIALGSAFELESQLLTLKNLDLSNEKELENLLAQVEEEQRMLAGLLKSKRALETPNT